MPPAAYSQAATPPRRMACAAYSASSSIGYDSGAGTPWSKLNRMALPESGKNGGGAVRTRSENLLRMASATGVVMAASSRAPARVASAARSGQIAVADDAELDLGRALEDLGQSGVAPVALDREVGGVAGATVDLQRLARDAFGHLTGEVLHHRGLVVDGVAG